jgi:hypothetical protein
MSRSSLHTFCLPVCTLLTSHSLIATRALAHSSCHFTPLPAVVRCCHVLPGSGRGWRCFIITSALHQILWSEHIKKYEIDWTCSTNRRDKKHIEKCCLETWRKDLKFCEDGISEHLLCLRILFLFKAQNFVDDSNPSSERTYLVWPDR